MTAALRLVAPQEAVPALEIDGSTDQRDELAAVLLELEELYQRLRDDRDRVRNVLRRIVLASGRRSFELDGVEFRLTPQSAWWCVEHNHPPAYCTDDHDSGNPVEVREVPLEPYLSIRRQRRPRAPNMEVS